ncbi:MAG: hypothetical protein KatS3mg088_178 [Patescibacteria group bacterium]|nr:MAG: hypothetical protein KatS3mg088_178 [Patescibacteria group bacterium]
MGSKETDIEIQEKKGENKKILIAILGILLLVTGLAIGIILVNQRQEIRKKAVTPTGTVKVFLSPETKNIKEGQAFSVNILLDTAGRYISAVTINLSYSYQEETPPILATDVQVNSSLVVNNNWSFPIKSVNNNTQEKNVEIRIGGLNSSSEGYKTNGEEVIATINFKAQSPGSINLTFNPTTSKVTDKSTAEDILLNPSSSGSYIVTSETPPSETPQATFDPTNPTPTASPSATIVAASTSPIPIVTPTPSLAPIPESGISYPTIINILGSVILLTIAFTIAF